MPSRALHIFGCSQATLFDDDGIMVRFLNSRAEGNGVRSLQDVQEDLLTAGCQVHRQHTHWCKPAQ
jgi:hypothetical protein